MRSVVRSLVAGATLFAAVAAAPVASADPAPPTQQTQCVQAGRGDAITGIPAAEQRLRFTDAWPITRGAGITVAVIDTGVTPHPALADRLVAGPDLVVPSENSLHDCDGHGTLVAGIIASGPVAGTEFSGVAPQARILSIRQASARYQYADRPGEPIGDVSTLAAAIDAAVGAGVQVINISQTGCPTDFVNAGDDQLEAAIAAAEKANVVVVAAAGNTGAGGSCATNNTPGQPPVTVPLPARFDTVLAVAAVGSTDAVADFSLAGPWVDVAAPGTNIVSLDPGPGATGLVNKIDTGGTLNDINGTSFATPYVSGVVALVRAAHPELTAAQVRQRITSTAQHPPSDDDRNDYVGYGIIDPVAAVTGLVGPSSPTSQQMLPPAPVVPVPDTGPRTTALIISGTAVAAMILVAAFMVSMRRAQRLRRERLGLAEPPPVERRTGHIEVTARRRRADEARLERRVGTHR